MPDSFNAPPRLHHGAPGQPSSSRRRLLTGAAADPRKFGSAEAPAGKLEIDSKNDASIPHDISLEGNGVDQQGDEVQGGGVSTVDVTLKPGEYTFYCSVPGHREGGMEGKLTVK